MFTASKNLDDVDDDSNISGVWKNVTEIMKASPIEGLCYYELKQYKPWLEEESSELLNKRNQAKLQWLQNPRQANGDNLNNITFEANRSFRKEKREYLKEKS